MATRPPLSNLGPMSEPWARWITDQTQQNEIAIERLGGDASNDGRANNSNMDLMASQINEIYQRQSGLVVGADMQTAQFNGTGTNAPMVAQNIQLPRPTDAERSGWLAVGFDVSQTNSEFGSAFLTLYIDGVAFHKNSIGFPTSLVTPASWGVNSNINGFTGFTANPGSGGLVRIELTPQSTSGSALRRVNATNINVTYQYSQRI